ncbi:MAG: glycosyltransferase family A protein [Gammaproteobacteria bacterium]|nr:glycosyltransferase family A protein [Gammaproteobacteria bacterium]
MKTSAAPGRAPTLAPNSATNPAPNPAPLVSIITPCRNAEAFIGAAIDSVRAQTLTDWEMLIVDDASTDASAAVIKDYAARDDRIRPLSQHGVTSPGSHPSTVAPITPQPAGAAAARNHAIAQARGRYIAFLDADDVWFADKLAKQTAFMAAHEQAFTYASYRLIDAADRDLGVFTVPPQITRADLLKVNSVSCLAAVYDARALGKMRMPALDIGHDYALWLAILKRVGSARGIVEPLAACRIQQPASLSGDKLRAARRRWRIYRRHERLSRAASAYYFCHYAYHGLLKYLWRARIARWLNHLRAAMPQTWRRK